MARHPEDAFDAPQIPHRNLDMRLSGKAGSGIRWITLDKDTSDRLDRLYAETTAKQVKVIYDGAVESIQRPGVFWHRPAAGSKRIAQRLERDSSLRNAGTGR